jgi:hypothetical protein
MRMSEAGGGAESHTSSDVIKAHLTFRPSFRAKNYREGYRQKMYTKDPETDPVRIVVSSDVASLGRHSC